MNLWRWRPHGTGPRAASRQWWSIRAVNRGRHADNMFDSDTPLAGRLSTVQDLLDRLVEKAAGAPCSDALNDRCPRDHRASSGTLLEGTIVGRRSEERRVWKEW